MTTWPTVVVALLAVAASAMLLSMIWKRSSDTGPEVAPSPTEQSRARQAQLHAFAPLIHRQRNAVRWAVHRGRQVSDPALAVAAVSFARWKTLTERERVARIQWWQLLGPGLIFGSVLIRVADRGAVRFGDALILIAFLSGFSFLIIRPRGRLRRAQQAERLNRQLLHGEPYLAWQQAEPRGGPSGL